MQKMKPIKQITDKYKSTYAAAKELNVTATQLHRLVGADAMVDESGQVWIKSKTVLNKKQEASCQN